MSFTDEYLALQNKKKKKKKEEQKTTTKSTGHSFTDDYLAQKATTKTEDIAPVFVNKTASLYSDPEKFIAPVTRITGTTKKEEEDERKWFQKGEFEDGYQIGDITKTILGTKTDISENLLAGVLGMGEKAVDAGAYIVGGVGGLFGNDDLKDKMSGFIKKDLYDEEKVAKKIIGVSASSMLNDMIGVDSEDSSVLGEKSDALVQSAGQLAGTLGLQAVGVPWFVTSGVVGFGSEVENALNQGATYGQAGASAAISAGAEILTEKLFGGSGLGETGLIAVDRLTKGITNKAVKALADYGVDILAEGSEEVISEFMSNLGSSLYKEKKLGEILFSEEAIDGYIESFIGGGVLGGVMNASNAVTSVKSGRDYRSGLSVNEQKVVQKEVENRIAEQEKGGKKLTDKEKAALEEAVIRDMEKGYISTDIIEEVLGGESYQTYKDTVDSEEALLKEYEELGSKQNATLAEQTRYNELHQQVQDLKQNSKRDLYKTTLSENVFRTVQNDRLTESYNERSRRGQAFEADLTKYNTEQQETIKKAVESGILNNTNRTHEFVDMIAKITADKGVLFDFTNNERLKESGFAVDGKAVNGYVTKDGVTLNIDSAKSLNSVVGHEITHVLEGTELYTALQSAVTEYAKTKGDYQGRYDSLSKLYEGVDGADVDAELTADLVGDYLFTDADFVRNLSVQHRNVFQKIYDEIKYLCKVATAGSKEARELEKVKRAFEQAYRATKNTADDSGAKYSLKGEKANLTAEEKTNLQFAKKMKEDGKSNEEIYKETGWYTQSDGKWRTEFATKAMQTTKAFNTLGLDSAVENRVKKHEASLREDVEDEFLTEAEAKEEIEAYKKRLAKEGIGSGLLSEFYDDEEMYSAYPFLRDVRLTFRRSLNKKNSFVTKYAEYSPDNEVIAVDRNACIDDGVNVRGVILHEIQHIIQRYEGFSKGTSLKAAGSFSAYESTKGEIEARDVESRMRMTPEERRSNMPVQFSLSDSDGKQLSKEQQEYFKDSKMRDEKGNLKVMYHGTQDAGFHVFDAKMSDDDTSFFFVDRNDVAASYSGTTETYEAKSFNTAEDANKFFAEIGRTEYRVVEKDGEYTLYDDGGEVATSKSLAEIYEEFCDYEGVGYGNANYKVYLNLKNPLVVDVEGRNWDNVSREFSQEIYDRYQTLTAEEKEALSGLAEWDDFSVFRSEIKSAAFAYAEAVANGKETQSNDALLASAYKKLGGKDTNFYDLYSITSDGFTEAALRQYAVKQFNTRDYAKRAKEQGYDGVIFNNIVDVGGYGGDYTPATVAIAFDSNQIKSVANEKPTADPDIRFSLSKPVEETDRLVALHNKSISGVMRMLERDGVPFPSVAIKKAGAPHEGFGECSVVFPRSTIDPAANRWNKLYSNDAWTPTEPRTEYDVGDTYKYKTLFENMLGTDIYHALRGSSYLDSDELAKEIGSSKGSVFDAVKRLGVVKYGYLQFIGQRPEAGTKQKTLDGFGKYKNDQLLAVFDAVDGEAIRNATYDDSATLQQIADALNEQFIEQIPSDKKESVFKMFGKKPLYTADNINIYAIKDAYDAWEAAGRTIPTEIDYYSLESALRSNRAIEEDADYQRWVEGIFDGVIKDSGIPNGKDYYTPSGNRRSFKQLHVPATLENIVQQMRKENETGVGVLGGINLRGAATKTYDTVEDMRKDSGKLLGTHIEDEVYDSYMNGFHERLHGLSSRAAKRDGWESKNTAEEILLEAIRDAKTKASMNTKLRKEADWINYDAALVEDLWQLKQDVQNMPAPYFEAKPRRIVSPYEAAAYIIPDNAPAKLIDGLNQKGLPYKTYKAGDEADRLRVLNGLLEEQPDLRFSLSHEGEQVAPVGKYNVYGKDIALETAPIVNEAPAAEPMAESAVNADEDEYLNQLSELRDKALTQAQELDKKQGRTEEESFQMQRLYQFADELMLQIEGRVNELFPDDMAPMADDAERLDSLTDADMPPETDAPYTETGEVTVDDPFEERDWYKVGNRKVNAYMYENPEVKPFFQEEAAMLLAELNDTIKGEKWYNDDLYYETNGEQGFGGVKRMTSDSIAEMLDGWGMSYADIEKGLEAIIKDNGAENIAAAKKIEFMLNERLLNGYKDYYTNEYIQPNEEYINLLNEKQITEYSTEAFDAFMANADSYAPPVEEDIAPVAKPSMPVSERRGAYMAFNAPVEKYEAIRPKRAAQPRMARATPEEQARAEILVDEPKVDKKKKNGLWNWAKVNLIDPGTVFETLSLKSGNPELQARHSAIKRAESRAQRFMENGNGMTSSLKSIRESVEKTGKTKQFYEYLYHLHNADRMTLEDRYSDVENKPVFGSSITADISNIEVAELEKKNPEFKRLAQEVYNYMGNLREMLVEGGVISEETAALWKEMYPHYVPIRREGHDGVNINVPLDTGRTGINAPIKRATGGNSNILPLFDTMGQRTIQTFKAVAKNRFGVELKNTLGTTIDRAAAGLDEVIEGVDTHEELLQEGKNGRSPTFTVFENGEKVTFEITDEMYDAMKPKSGAANINIKALNAMNNVRRGLITEYNPVFAITNPIKDIQDVLINSKHPARTYANMPKAIGELMSNGHWYREYLDNGGEQNTYFEGETNTFVKEKSTLRKVVGFPIDKLSQVNNFIEKVPRLAEYIASRKAGRSIDVSMLDAARVTTDFSAGGHITKMMNRNGFTFLNASVQGAVQQVRNIREAKHNGLKGWAQLAAKTVAAGLPAILLNHLLWEDDEEYEELSDYVKQNYYIVGKFGDGKFVRIPKGRTLAVIQNGFEQMEKLITGNDEADLEAFTELVISNLAPNNPLDNNIIAPIAQALRNETWYGEDLVPTRLQDLPSAEQYDESTDVISRWLGERTPFSPYKINYLLDQYSGGLGDTFLPMLTPEAERGDDTFVGNLLAPLRDKFTTDAVMNNQNVSDFYDKKDELTVNANATGATDEDVLKNKYMNSVNADLAKLYAEKRKIQNSDLPDAEKYAAVRDVQSQIVALTRESLGTYENISYEEDDIAVIGDKYFKQNDEGEWSKMSDDQVTKYEATSAAGDSDIATDGTTYWQRGEDDEWRKMTDDQVSKYKATTAAGDSNYATDGESHWRYHEGENGNESEWRKLDDEQVEKQEMYTHALNISAEDYWQYTEDIGNFDAKDENGKSVSGLKKERVYNYIFNELDIDYGAKCILYRSQYDSKADKAEYNSVIVDYLNSRDDISYEEMEAILKKLDFTVSSDGTISW